MVLDFEKTFDDHNRLSDKYNERLENYLDVLAEMSKIENKTCDY